MGNRIFGSIRKLPSGHYKGRYMRDGIYYSTPATKTKRETQNLLDVVHSQIVLGTWQPPTKNTDIYKTSAGVTCAELVQGFYRKLDEEDMSPNTKRSYRSTLTAHFLPKYGTCKVRDITQKDIQKLIDKLKTRYAPTTVNNIRRTISTFFTYAQEQEIIETNPTVGVKVPSKTRGHTVHQPVALTAEELSELLEVIPKHLRLFFALGSWCALRYSEIACLTKNDIDLKYWTVTVDKGVKRDVGGRLVVGTPKSKAGYRTITIPENIHDLVEQHLARLPKRERLLFPNPSNPYGFYSDRYIRSVLREALQTVGFAPMRFHDLRHTGLTLYGRAGATLADLMYRAGHTSADTVMIYQQSSLRRDAQLANRMGSL